MWAAGFRKGFLFDFGSVSALLWKGPTLKIHGFLRCFFKLLRVLTGGSFLEVLGTLFGVCFSCFGAALPGNSGMSGDS